MSKIHKNKHILVGLLFVSVLILFFIAAYFESERSRLENSNDINSDVQILSSRISSYINATINHADGIVSFIESYPDLNQEEFSDFVSKVGNDEYSIVSHQVAIKDTTIVFSYPLQGNESGIGVDLLDIEDQREEILKVKNDRVSLLVGPVELVEGGRYMINRMPVVIEDDNALNYWGQLSTIIKFEALLEKAGINEFSKENDILIEYVDDIHNKKKLIYTNSREFGKNKLSTIVDIPNGKWRITAESRNGYTIFTPVFIFLIITGFVMAVVSSLVLNYLLQVNERLNDKVEERTHDIRKVNQELADSIKELKSTQGQLIDREKHAAMGELVAGVAHEINTPLGVSVTAISYLNNLSDSLSEKLSKNILKKSELKDGLENIVESSHIVSMNLERASELINSFKRLSSDQHVEEKKKINLKEYIDYIIRAVSPTFRNTKHSIHCHVDSNINVTLYAGGLSQVMTILLMNSFVHGFESIENGQVIINAHKHNKELVIDYFDNGQGIPEEISEKVFNPFFTTKRVSGNTGLGLNIAYNIMTQQLEGDIALKYDIDFGVHFKLSIPIK